MMSIYENEIEPTTASDMIGQASWERPRASDELQAFIAGKALDFSEIYDSL